MSGRRPQGGGGKGLRGPQSTGILCGRKEIWLPRWLLRRTVSSRRLKKMTGSRWIRKPAEWFIFLFRGSPLFIQFFLAYEALVLLPRTGIDILGRKSPIWKRKRIAFSSGTRRKRNLSPRRAGCISST